MDTRIHIGGKKKKKSVWIIEHWKRLSRKAADSMYLGAFKVQLDKSGANWSEFSFDLLLAGSWTRWPHPKVLSSLNGSVKLTEQIIFQKLPFNYLQKHTKYIPFQIWLLMFKRHQIIKNNVKKYCKTSVVKDGIPTNIHPHRIGLFKLFSITIFVQMPPF